MLKAFGYHSVAILTTDVLSVITLFYICFEATLFQFMYLTITLKINNLNNCEG